MGWVLFYKDSYLYLLEARVRWTANVSSFPPNSSYPVYHSLKDRDTPLGPHQLVIRARFIGERFPFPHYFTCPIVHRTAWLGLIVSSVASDCVKLLVLFLVLLEFWVLVTPFQSQPCITYSWFWSLDRVGSAPGANLLETECLTAINRGRSNLCRRPSKVSANRWSSV